MEIPGKVADWLLEDENPSVRYRFLKEFLSEKESDSRVREARACISGSKPVLKIFRQMHPDGFWLHRGKGAGVGYACPASTHYILSFLAELGLNKDDSRIDRAVNRYLSLTEPDVKNPLPWQIPPDYRNHQSCLYAFNLRTFQMLGYGDDPRIEERKRVLLEDRRFDGGYLCDRPSFKPTTKSCIRGSIKALMGYSCFPDLWGHERCNQLVDYFINRRVVFKTTRPDELVRDEMFCLMFPFIHNGNLIEPLYALSRMGFGKRVELTPSWDQLRNRQLADGSFPIDKAPLTVFKSGENGKPNKWVTFYAYMALKYRDKN